MHDDDVPRGHLLSRREALTLLGTGGAMLALGPTLVARAALHRAGVPRCVVRPEMVEGPYYVDEALDRSDIRANPADGRMRVGAPLALTFAVSRVVSGSCRPFAGAVVDVWHCDAEGVYTDVVDPLFDTKGDKALRGYQVTGADGIARFTTIYPGWYPGRTVHIHFKVRSRGGSARAHEFTSQLFFDDAFTDRVFTRAPYAAKGPRDTLNAADSIFRTGGDQLVLDVKPKGQGYAATFEVALHAI